MYSEMRNEISTIFADLSLDSEAALPTELSAQSDEMTEQG
jgi:hypothetical protein